MSNYRIVGTRCFTLFAIVVGLLAAPSTLLAGTGEAVSVPNALVKKTNGIELTVDFYWVDGHGYRPVRFVATADKPATFDRVISVRFMADSRYYYRSNRQVAMTASQKFVLPADAVEARTTIAVPQYHPWQRVAWEVSIDGHFARELSVEGYPGPAQQNSGQQAAPRVIVIDRNTPQRPTTQAPVPVPGRKGFITATSAAAGDSTTTAIRLRPIDLPTRWIDYSCVDIVYVEVGDLKSLVENQAEAHAALRQWVLSGGNLFVGNVGPDLQRKQAVETALSLATETGAAPWQSTRESRPPANRTGLPNGSVPDSDFYRDQAVERYEQAKEQKRRDVASKYAWRSVGFGTVLALADTNLRRDLSDSTISWTVPSLDRQWWTRRHGISPQFGTSDFWDLLIPGVGLPPVNAFQFLITIFVIVIGPANYFLLRRWQRLHLLLFTVPICAGVVTCLLFGYALFSDGLGTRVRVRSFTEIDQRNGEAASWSRQSYYSGLAPRGGLRMPSDAVVVPLRPTSDDYKSPDYGRQYEVNWAADQRLSRGWIDSRTATQFMVMRSAKTDRRLSVRNNDGRVAVGNQLATRIRQLVLCDAAGNLYWGESIDDGASAELEPVSSQHAASELMKIFRQNMPRTPDEMSHGGGQFFRRRYRAYWSGNPYDDVRLATSRLEWAMDKYGPHTSYEPQPESYLAIVETSPEVPVGVDDAERVGSFNVLYGRW